MRIRFLLIVCVTMLLSAGTLSAVLWTYDFGTGSDSYTTANSSSTTYLAPPTTPTGGGTYRVRVANGGGGFYRQDPGLVNFGAGTELRLEAPTTSGAGGINKFSVAGYTSGGQVARTGYERTQIRLGSSTGGTADSGTFYYFLGTGTSFSDDNPIGLDQAMIGIRWVLGTGGTVTTSWYVDNAWTSFTGFTFQQGVTYTLEFFTSNGNGNQANNYSCGGVSGTVTTPSIDMWVNGTLVGDELANGWTLAKNIAFTSFMFYGESSTGNVGNLFLDSMAYSNDLDTDPYLPTYYEFYSKTTGVLNTLANWGTYPDGTGTAPASFTTASQTFHIQNNPTPTINANWVVSGTGTSLILGDGTNSCNFTIPSAYTLTGTINVSNMGILNLQGTTYPTFGTLATGSTVRYSAAGNQTVFTTTYSNLSIQGTGTKTINGNITANTRTYVGDGTNTVTFTIPSTFSLTSTVDVLNAGILDIANTTLPTLGTLSSGSTVRYSATTSQSVSGAAYSYLQVYGTGTKTLTGTASAGNNTTVGDGTNNVTLYVPAAYGLTGTTNVMAGNTLILTSTTIPTMGTLGTNSVVRYDATGNQNVAGGAYSYLQIYGTGIKTMIGAVSAGISTTVGDGSNTVTMTVPGSYALTGLVNVGAGSTLNLENTTTPTLGTLGSGSYVIYAALGNQSVTGTAYQYLRIFGSGTKTITGANASAVYATQVGDGTNSVSFVIPSAYYFTGTVDVNNLGILVLQNTTLPTLGTLATGSTVRYDYAGNQNVTGTTYYNLDIANGSTKTMQNNVTVTNITFTGGTMALNGYNLYLAGKYISFYSTNAVFSDLLATYVDGYVAMQGVGRIWSTNGSFTNTVDVSFTFPYGTTPANLNAWYKGDGGMWTQGVLTTPSYAGGNATVTLSGLTTLAGTGAKGNMEWTFAETDETLPVELSSFTAVFSNMNMVNLQWVTQSETNVAGFRIYRNTESELSSATMLNLFVPATNTSQMQVYVVSDEEVYQDGTYYYWLENLDMDGSSTLHGPISVTVAFNNGGSPSIPLIPGLNNAYPNPFHPDVNLELSMDKAGWMELEIYNLKGQKVKTIYSGSMDKGSKTLKWDSRDQHGRYCPNGIYFAIMRTNSGSVSKLKLMLMK